MKIILQWTPPAPPCEGCRYNHSIAPTPFGRFLLTWKEWKHDPVFEFDETPWGEVEYHDWDTMEEAQAWATKEMEKRILALLSPS